MKLRTALCLLITAALLFTAGCAGKQTTEENSSASAPTETPVAQTLSLLCCGNDSLNPYTAITKTNQELSSLLFDPLIKLDRNFEPVYVIAQSANVERTVCTVTLKSISFTDGSALTAEDVVFSFNLAKASKRFEAQLKDVLSASGSGNTVRFTLAKSDPYAYLLLDFPILKKGSDERVNGDNVALPPIGCGRYTIDDTKTQMTANANYHGGKVNIGTIYLTNTPDDESIAHNVEVGSTDLYYTDVSNGEIIRMSAKKVEVPLNHLVFIGINLEQAQLKNPYLRYAISSAIDRTEIVKTAYYENATAAEGPFPSAWERAKGYQTLQSTPNEQIALENLRQIGYNKKDSQGYFVDEAGNRLHFRLLVNAENQSRATAADLIVKQLAACGIEITLEKRAFAEYKAALEAGDFDLYLAEVKLTNNMDLTPLVTHGGSVAYGIPADSSEGAEASSDSSQPPVSSEQGASSSEGADSSSTSSEGAAQGNGQIYTAATAAAGFYSGQNTIGDVITAFLSEMPIVPVCHRNGILFYDTDLTPEPAPSVSDVFFSIESLQRTK